MNAESIPSVDYLPTDERLAEIICKIDAAATHWERNHFHRVAYMSHCLLKSLSIAEPTEDAARAASFLFHWATTKNSCYLFKSDLLAKNKKLRTKLGTLIKDSSQ